MIQVQNLSFSYQEDQLRAVDDVSFSFPEKGLFYIIGESGSGKSTFIKLLSGRLTNYEGSVLFNGSEIKGLTENQRRDILFDQISLSSQDDLFDSEETVLDCLLLGLEIYPFSRAEKINRITRTLEDLSIEGLASKKVKSLSGGEIKRISLARALVKESTCLFLDEPLGPLDRSMRLRLTSYFHQLGKEKLVIVISHAVSEIAKSDNVLSFKDGKMTIKHLKKEESRNEQCGKANFHRKRFTSVFLRGIKLLSAHKKRTFSSLSSLCLSLVALGLITIISSSVSTGLKNYLSGDNSKNTMLIEQRNKEVISGQAEPLSYSEAAGIKSCYSEYIYGIGASYDLNFEDSFLNSNKVFFKIGSSLLTLNSLSGRSFMDFSYYKELGKDLSFMDDLILSKDEIVLGLTSFEASSLAAYLDLSNDDYYTGLDEYIKYQGLSINLELINSKINYQLKYSFDIVKVVPSSVSQIIHTDPLFSESFVEDIMHFQSYSDLNYSPPNAWTVFKEYFLYVDNSIKESFLEKFVMDKRMDSYLISQLVKNIDNSDIKSGRMQIRKKNETGILFSDIHALEERYKGYLLTTYLSDNFYYCSSQGQTSGFLKPIYASAKRELLNQIADYNYQADFDLNGFQGATIVFDQGVIMGDLSGVNKDSLGFFPYEEEPAILKGIKPKDFSQVLISSKMAEELFSSSSNALNQKLFLTCLKETVNKDGGYKNIFKDGEVKISGIVKEDDLNLIYQKPRFLQALENNQLDFVNEEMSISHALITFKGGYDLQIELKKLTELYPNYKFSLPNLEISESVDEIISYIGKGLLAFGLFSGLIALALMSLVMMLNIDQGEERIRAMVNMGFLDSDIKRLYLGLTIILSATSYLFSSGFLWLFSKMFSWKLSDLLGVDFASSSPLMFISNLIFSIVICGLGMLISDYRLDKKLKSKNIL